MGTSLTKSHLERRNTVARRTQRKSIHKTKDKIDTLYKEIGKFGGIDEEDDHYQEIKAKLEELQKEIQLKRKDLQPQVRFIYSETHKKIDDGLNFLNDKLKENQEKAAKKAEKKAAKDGKKEVKSEDSEDADVEVEEVTEQEDDTSPKRRSTINLHVVQLESPPVDSKRMSILKIGVPVLPGSIKDALFRKSANQEELINETRKEIEAIELEISKFVGRRNGRYYTRLQNQLEVCRKRINLESSDDAIKEQVKLCNSYIDSCLRFLEDKATDVDFSNTNKEEDEDEVFHSPESNRNSIENLSPRSIKTTYI